MAHCGCPIGFGALLFIVYKYSDSLEKAILASVNAGGDNVARNSLLGPLFGAAYGFDAFPSWMHELHQKDAIMAEI
jgi:ADP-ribosyl-[dinitrogen reductase] hydrolase